ncbi:MAG: ABC transporter permease [Candidatus Eiseniibacteriota bacterium]|nr:MAG: ABC transporter permease [Candidatus Eisenbacteria bacterium]
MKLSNVRTVLWKEVIDSLRDSRTIFLMIALPLIIYPALFTGLGYFERLVRKRQREAGVSVAVVNYTDAHELVEFLSVQEKFEVLLMPRLEGEGAADVVRGQVANVALVVPDGFDELVKAGTLAGLTVLYDGADMISVSGRDRVISLLREYGSEVVRSRLEGRGLDVSILDTMDIGTENVATAGEMGAFAVGTIVPFFLIILMCAGAQHTAIDVTVGEKERSTLETILASSASRTEVVFGKFVAVMLASLATAIMGLVGLLLTIYSGLSFMTDVGEGSLTISFSTVMILLLTLLPVMVFVAATFVAIGCFAKSIKEGQTYSSYFYMLIMLSAVVTIFPGFETGLTGYAVPLLGVLFLEKEILTGGFDIVHTCVALLSTLAIAVGALLVSVKLFSNEKVMFRV